MLKIGKKAMALLAIMALTGCATLPTGPSVMVMPGEGKTFEEFQKDDANCRQWASQQIGTSAQEVANQNTATCAVVGTVIGAGLGAASGNPGAGAAIGAGSGLLLGTAEGANAGQVAGWEAQRRYDYAYMQCMYSNGNQVPKVGEAPRRYYRTVVVPQPVYYYPVYPY